MMGLKPGEKIRILKENQSFFPSWWGKGRFTAFSCHNQARSLGSQTEYWIFFLFFFFHSRKQIQYFLILLRCGCRAGEPAPLGEDSRPPQEWLQGRLCLCSHHRVFCLASSVPRSKCQNRGRTWALPKRRKRRDGEGRRRPEAGPRRLFSCPGNIPPCPGHGTSPPPASLQRRLGVEESEIPYGNLPGTRVSSCEAFAGLLAEWQWLTCNTNETVRGKIKKNPKPTRAWLRRAGALQLGGDSETQRVLLLQTLGCSLGCRCLRTGCVCHRNRCLPGRGRSQTSYLPAPAPCFLGGEEFSPFAA